MTRIRMPGCLCLPLNTHVMWNTFRECPDPLLYDPVISVCPARLEIRYQWAPEHRRIDAFKLWCWRRVESALDCKEIQPAHSEGDQSWVFIGRTDAKAETPILWPLYVKSWLIGKKPWCWEGLGAGGEGDGRGWDGWMASPTRWTWVWVNSGSWWWTVRPGVLRFMGSQRVGHDWATALNWTE